MGQLAVGIVQRKELSSALCDHGFSLCPAAIQNQRMSIYLFCIKVRNTTPYIGDESNERCQNDFTQSCR